MDRLTWIDLMNAYGIDISKGGGADFAELVLMLINGWRWTGEMPSVGNCVGTMLAMRKTGKMALYSRMKNAVYPLLQAADITLDAWDLSLKNRTSTALAAAIAEREILYLSRGRDAKR